MLAETRTQWFRAKPFHRQRLDRGPPGSSWSHEHPDVIAKIRESGRRVHCWVVNTPATRSTA
jgi:hypothetical protein